MTANTWSEIESSLNQLYSLPHNMVWLREKGISGKDAVGRKLAEIRSGLIGDPKREDFCGRKLFLRMAGPTNAAYAGEWWFDAEMLDKLDHAYSRIYFDRREKDEAIRNMLREGLAISADFRNAMTEIWALELPHGEKLVGYTGYGAPQKLFGSLPIGAIGNRLLVGKLRQIYFPVKNPLWVRLYRNLF